MKVYSLLTVLCLISMLASAQSHWESIILAENTWQYFEGNSEPQEGWKALSFDDSSWKQGAGGIGYDDGDDATVIPVVASLYMRKNFEVNALSDIEKLLLYIDYDDGFVAYINGVEVARSFNVTAEKPLYNSGTTIYREALMYSGGLPEQYTVGKEMLTQGTNVLAIHILNYGATSSDLSALPFLLAEVNSASDLYQATPSWFVEPKSYDSSNLPIVKINTSGQNILDDPKITAHMGIINNGYGNLNHLTDTFSDYDGYIGIETRGQSSLALFPKKSYGFETRDEYGENLNVNLLGMPKENDWVLYAPYSDKSMLRNAMTFELAKSLGVYSSRLAFCELYLNDQYQGVYILMEKIKRDDSRVNVDSLTFVSGDDNSLTGGYIFKVDKIDGDYANLYTGWTTRPSPSFPNAMDITYQYVYPKADDIETGERNYLKNHVTEAEKVLISDNFNNKETGYNKYFNLGSFVDFMLINEVSKEVDKYRYSTYFHKKKDSRGGEIFAGPIWDFNLGYGNVDYWDDGNLTSGWVYTDVQNVEWGIMFWWKRFMQDAYFNSVATARYHELREDEWSDDNVKYLIDSISSYIYDAQDRNYEKWPTLGTYVWPNKLWYDMTYDDEVASFESWILARLAWMDNNMMGATLSPSATLSMTGINTPNADVALDVKLNDVYFNHSQLKKKHFEIKGDDGVLDVDCVIYLDATSATLLVDSEQGDLLDQPIYVKVDDNALTSFNDQETNTINLTASIDDTQTTPALQIYASAKQLTVASTAQDLAGTRLKVFNTQGQLLTVLVVDQHRQQSFMLELPDGIYLVSTSYNGRDYTQKVMLID